MEAYYSPSAIQTRAQVALESEDERLSAEALAELQHITLHGIVVVTENALTKAP